MNIANLSRLVLRLGVAGLLFSVSGCTHNDAERLVQFDKYAKQQRPAATPVHIYQSWLIHSKPNTVHLRFDASMGFGDAAAWREQPSGLPMG